MDYVAFIRLPIAYSARRLHRSLDSWPACCVQTIAQVFLGRSESDAIDISAASRAKKKLQSQLSSKIFRGLVPEEF